MLLTITTSKKIQTINLDKSFFIPTQVVKRGQLVTLTPVSKAFELAADIGGKDLRAFSLWEDNQLIINHEEERHLARPAKAPETRRDVDKGNKPSKSAAGVNPNQNLGSSR